MSLIKLEGIGTWDAEEFLSFNYFYINSDGSPNRLSKNQTKIRQPINGNTYYFMFKFFIKNNLDHNYLDFRLKSTLYRIYDKVNIWGKGTIFPYQSYINYACTWRKL